MNKEWEAQLPILVDAYLTWQAGLAEAGLKDATVKPWQMLVVNFFNTEIRTFTPLSACACTNEVLVRGRFLGTAPQLPMVAISFQVLEAYRQLHHICPRLSIYAQVKALCRLHAVPFNRPLVEQFSVAYDVYMDILHGVDRLIATALDRNTPNWCMLNACAPCLYYLDDEPLLKYSLLATMDGNQLLKLVDDQFRSGHLRDDGRSARTGIWILPEEVDRFKNEVRQSVHTTPSVQGTEDQVLDQDDEARDEDVAWLDLAEAEDEKLQASVEVCTERWCNAGPEAREKMFALFAVTGVFVCLCRHGHLLLICDMIRSRELYVYLNIGLQAMS
ncbi:hypothetical protein WOLCODRAFT_111004 [Wolfiporia cocos MD-104 SS10]|uniref:CxC1-like cysteine cluster associated with KDZ transposases domain-containing protein n=1 Tax=Wolfiporia cocos (strain MD-104) TaxID=742152 RepID=A0A2H3IZR2_WOLCO|nr:hypothetical protein WOLCODRAFT_111004 [Wolfiporia cocos MD-104 SS10]